MKDDMIYSTLKDVSDWAPIPIFSELATTTLSIHDNATNAQGNKEALKSLASHTARVVYVVIVGLQHEGRNGVKYTSLVTSNLRRLLDELNQIEDSIQRHKDKRKWYRKILGLRADDSIFAAHRESLNRALMEFGLNNSTELKALARQLMNKHREILDGIMGDAPREVIALKVYGSMLPSSFRRSIVYTAGYDVGVNFISGNLETRTHHEDVVNVNSGRSYTYLCT
ncbi:hypothetical protein AX16_010965 [Volvariella volvacea WC 439]|nr:hypothetical protein AX16_010965 [Volvariella volvacea WC 439]